MRAPMSWLAEYAELPDGTSARELADRLLATGLEVERVITGTDELSGPIVIGRVLDYADEPQNNGKRIRWCHVDVGEDDPRGIVCGAHNFAAGDLVVVALPGAVLPGEFAITARKTYGHVSDGMICSARELKVGDDHAGIIVLPPDAGTPGDDPLGLLGLREAVLDIAVTTDRGYCLSIRGVAREAAAAFDVPFREVTADLPEPDGKAYEIHIDDLSGCDRFSAMAATGLDPAARSPEWLVTRLRQCGMRSISLAVDVTNYVMLETGQPLHAFDRGKLHGPIRVRRATAGEKLVTLDGVARALDPDDMLVTDDGGPIALAGVMGGASTEIDPDTTDVVLEAAHWDPDSIARAVRRHKLPSEAARRFERGVDPEIAGVALARCVALLVAHGGARTAAGYTVVGTPAPPPVIEMDSGEPEIVAGMPIGRDTAVRNLEVVGCQVRTGPDDALLVTPPPWRPDLLISADLVEEVVRLAGYERLPSVLPAVPSGTGLTARQRLERAVPTALAAAGAVEVISFPFVSPAAYDRLGLPADDPRRRATRLVNPLSEDEPELRTFLLPGLLAAAVRNVGRGLRDFVLFESGLVFEPPAAHEPAPLPAVTSPPSAAEVAALDATLPRQPRHLAAVLCGELEQHGWWGAGRVASWSDAIELARVAARAAHAELDAYPADYQPWHPGRCAQLRIGQTVLGHAGELHPRVVAALGLPERTCAFEINQDLLPLPAPPPAPVISSYPPVLLDVALVVPSAVASAAVLATLRSSAGPLLESIRLFDVYSDEQRLGPGRRSLAFSMRFRALDRTLTLEEATAALDVAVSAVAERYGAELRS